MHISDKVQFLKSLLKEDKQYSRLEFKKILLLKNYKELSFLICDLINYEINQTNNKETYICNLNGYIRKIYNNRINKYLKEALRNLEEYILDNNTIEKLDFDFLLELINDKKERVLKKIFKKYPSIVNCKKDNEYLFEKLVKSHIEICKSLKPEDYEKIFYNESIIKLFVDSNKFKFNTSTKDLIRIINKVIEKEMHNKNREKDLKKGSIYFLENLRNIIKENKISEEHLNYKYNKKDDFSNEAYSELSNLKCLNSDFFDLTNVYTISIDNISTIEIDDAISLEYLKNGNKLLYIHISNPSNYIKIGSQIEKEASERVESIYLCDKTIFMFPLKICGDLCSLKNNSKRFTNTIVYELDKDNNILNHKHLNAVINVDKNISYFEGNELLKNGNNKNSVLLRDLREIVIKLSKNKNCNNANKIVDYLMSMGNTTYANDFYKLKYPFIYKVKLKPNLEDKKNLSEFLHKKDVDKQELYDSLSEPFYSKENLGHCDMGRAYANVSNPIRSYPDYVDQILVSRCLIKEPSDKELKFFDNVICNSVLKINEAKKNNKTYVEEYNKLKALTKNSKF